MVKIHPYVSGMHSTAAKPPSANALQKKVDAIESQLAALREESDALDKDHPLLLELAKREDSHVSELEQARMRLLHLQSEKGSKAPKKSPKVDHEALALLAGVLG